MPSHPLSDPSPTARDLEHAARAFFNLLSADIRAELQRLRDEVRSLRDLRVEVVTRPDPPKADQYLNQREAAEYLGCSQEFLRLKRREGDFPEPVKLSARDLRWSRAALEEWIQRQGSDASGGETA